MKLPMPVELNDAELDAVAAGASANAGGLVAVAAAIDDVRVLALNNNKVDIANGSLNGNKTNVGAGVLINLLGGPSVIRGTQTTA